MRIGLFFGAGAEICYGLPSGGRFAIDLFRQDSTQYKSELRDQLRNLDAMSPYATNWLPQGYLNKRIHAFGRNEFTSLIESSIEYRKDEIIRRLNQFDSECDTAINALGIDREELSDSFERATGRRIGDSLYTQVIRLNALLSNDVQIFGSEFYSAMLDILRNRDDADDLRRYVAAFLQLLVGAHGQELVQRLNQDLFEVAPDDLPIFDDISGMFRLEFSRAGSTALELLLEESRQFDTSQDASITSLLCAIAQQVLENIFTTVLDYQKLIDDHFRYLFSPRTEWAKFTKMVIFLRTARDYIQAQSPSVENMPDGGYYHDLAEASHSDLTISAVGTANYNSLLENISHSIGLELPPVMHLNGSVRDCYNPYKNSVSISDQAADLPNEQIQVPFILTQSGLKPLTSVAMSRRYVKLFDAYRESDAIVVVGFGFNVDDNHINGLFRELIESEGKPLYWICLANSGTQQDHQRILMRNLRLDPACRNLVRVVTVDEDRQNNNTTWLAYMASDLASPQHEGD